ncbi:DUF222 domain-containing protein [Rhodococcus sp. NPDC127528]|uniref:HNH endonuclease signature motif containing protein n=1 Tax=unclassified Rhodococcus (in: high G+C Gram-positive bacteria) TaxID=192944 RepID=UPI00364185C2
MDIIEMLTTPRNVEAWRLDESTLLSLVPELSARLRQLDALRVRLVHEIHERGATRAVGATSTQEWLSGSAKLTPAQAKRIVTAGQSLTRRPEVAGAFADGVLDIEQVRTITGLLDQIPDLTAGIAPECLGGVYEDPAAECAKQCTEYLLATAATDNANDTTVRTAALKTMITPEDDGPPPDDENDQLNELFASPTAGGRVRIKGHFDKTTGEQLMTALSALSRPQPGRNTTSGDPQPDPRSAPQRRADAFGDIVRHYLDTAAAPGEGGERPHVTVFVGLDNLARATRNTSSGNDSEATTNPADAGRQSFFRRGPAWMPWLGPISDRLAALISCDASITPIVMDAEGNPLDVGRTTRTIPRRLRRALDARDCGCAFPGCGRPAAWTDGHHIQHWSNGGETKLSNLLLLCRFHHRLIHKGDWSVFIGDDNHPWFIPPAWIDFERRPVPAHNRRQPPIAS